MTDNPSPEATASGPAAEFRIALDTAIDAIMPFAVQGESRNYERSTLDVLTFPLRHPVQALRGDTDMPELLVPIDEAAAFAGLSGALKAFLAAVGTISFPSEHTDAVNRVSRATQSVVGFADRHAVRNDVSDPAVDKDAAKEFKKVVSEWEDATADLAADLGL